MPAEFSSKLLMLAIASEINYSLAINGDKLCSRMPLDISGRK